MFRMKSIFDRRYFRYSARRILPMTVAVNIIMVISSFCFYITSGRGLILFGEVSDFSAVLSVFSFIYPILLAFVLFKFVFSKKQTDMIGSFPIKRNSLFFTNTVLAAIVIAVTVFFSSVVSIFTRIIVYGNNIYIAWQIFFYMFFFWFAVYLSMFLIAAVGCMLTGHIISALIMSVFMVASLDLCVLIGDLSFSYYYPRFLFRFVPPFQALYNMIINSSHYYHSVWYILYSFAFCAGLLFLGMYCSKVRKYETAENLFINNIVLNAVRFGVYLPVAGLFWLLVINAATFELLFLFVVIGIFVFEVIINWGIRKNILKGLIVFGISAAVALLVYIPYGLRFLNADDISIEKIKITEVTVSAPRLDQYMLSSGSREEWIDIKINDDEILTLIENDMSAGNSYIFYYSDYFDDKLIVSCKDSDGEYRYLDSNTMSEKLLDTIINYLCNDEEYLKKFFWEDFNSDGYGMFVFSTEGYYPTAVIQGVSCKRESRVDYSKDNIKNSLKNRFDYESQKFGDHILYDSKGANVGVYFKNGHYYIRFSELRDENKKTEMLKEVNSKFSGKKGSHVTLLTLGQLSLEDRKKLQMINYDSTDSYIDVLDIQALKNGEIKADDCIAILNETFGNFYELCFAPKDSVLANFNRWYDKRAEDAVKNIASAYNFRLSVGFEKYYIGDFGIISMDQLSYGKFSELAKYYMTYEEYCNIPDTGMYFTLDFVINSNFMPTLYIPVNEETTVLAAEIEKMVDVRLWGNTEDYSMEKFIKSDFPEIEAIMINGIEITDRNDIEYLAKGLYIDRSIPYADYERCDCFYFADFDKVASYDEEELYNKADRVGSIVFTENMIKLLGEKYKLISNSGKDSKFLFTVVIKQG